MRPFEGVKILDCTHVLAGLSQRINWAGSAAEVIKVEIRTSRIRAASPGLTGAQQEAMGTGFLTQGSNSGRLRSISRPKMGARH